jgi:hydroxymethylpyrimidine/phosphomethylpyrimidine kinase
VTAYSLGKGNNPEVLRPVWGSTIARQLDAALDQGPEAALIGILGRARHVKLVAQQLTNRGPSALVLAPMSSAFDIAPLVNTRLFAAIRRCLIPEARAVVLTANNAATLMGASGESLDDLRGIGQKILALGAGAAWIRASPRESRQIDVFVDQEGSGLLDYQATNEDVETHTSAASLATLLALGTKLRPAVNRAHRQAYRVDRELHPA